MHDRCAIERMFLQMFEGVNMTGRTLDLFMSNLRIYLDTLTQEQITAIAEDIRLAEAEAESYAGFEDQHSSRG